MQQPYGNYPYYGPPMFTPQTPFMGAGGPGPPNGYPPFYGPPNPQQPAQAPLHSNPPAPSPYSFDAAAYTPKAGPVLPTQPTRHRRNPTIPVAPDKPLKSAMKKTMTAINTAENAITRQISNTYNQAQNPAPRQRALSNPTKPQLSTDESQDRSSLFHILVTFYNYNELRIENIQIHALEEVRKVVWPVWPDGVESDLLMGQNCFIKFRNTPWDLSGPNVRHAYKLIVEFFRLFQRRGYSFQAAVNLTTANPRLIFQVTQPDENAEFFLAYFSQEGRRVTLINPPQRIDISIGARLRSALPRKFLSDNVVEEYTRVIEIKRKTGTNSAEMDPTIFYLEVLRILNQLGFQLDAAVPLGRRGPLGIRYPRELLVFKALPRDV